MSRSSALDAIFGYTLCNDVGARNIQFEDDQITMGKGCDTFAPLGLCVVTPDEVGDPQSPPHSAIRPRTFNRET